MDSVKRSRKITHHRRLAVASLLALTGSVAFADDSIVATDKGAVKGTLNSTYRAFLGIPFAAPPVGNLRWKAPQSAAAWSGTRNATTAGGVCLQTGFGASGPTTRGGEDCLYLNVYTPYPTSPTKLPVMVWIHGGAYTGGAGSDYDASVLAKKANAIVVTLNYRLGALGFLAHPALTAESKDSSGNFGLLDQQAAIKWVKTNIANFGGDITRTTIFGESAGSASVCANVLSPKNAGYFQRAIMESGSCTGFGFISLANAETTGKSFASLVGCTANDSSAAACLRSVSTSSILSNQSAVPGASATGISWAPTIGGAVLPKLPKDALTSGSYNKVPILQGTNHDEGTLFILSQYDATGNPLTTDQYTQVVNQQYGSSGSAVLAQYPASNYSSPSYAYSTVFGDSTFSCPARTTDRLLVSNVSVYAYEFNDPNAPNAFSTLPMGAYHGSEIQFIFQAADTSALTAAELDLSNKMIKYWAAFAATGNPAVSGQTAWPKYSSSTDQVLKLSPTSIALISNFSADHKCSFWASLGI